MARRKLQRKVEPRRGIVDPSKLPGWRPFGGGSRIVDPSKLRGGRPTGSTRRVGTLRKVGVKGPVTREGLRRAGTRIPTPVPIPRKRRRR